MARGYDTITLLSDLGRSDESVGLLHALLRELAAHASVIDLSHHVTPDDVRGASVMLARASGYLPSGVVVVGVGAGITADRRCVAVQVADGEGIFLGPDSGVLAPAVAMVGGAQRAVVLDRADAHAPSPGATWPLRDILVPVAAALCNGADLVDLGTEIDAALLLPGVVPVTRDEPDRILAEVLSIDRVGTCQLNLDPADLAGWGDVVTVTVGEHVRSARRIDGGRVALRAGEIGAVTDAFGMVSLIAAERSAAAELGAAVSTQVVFSKLESERPQGIVTAVRLSAEPSRPRVQG